MIAVGQQVITTDFYAETFSKVNLAITPGQTQNIDRIGVKMLKLNLLTVGGG